MANQTMVNVEAKTVYTFVNGADQWCLTTDLMEARMDTDFEVASLEDLETYSTIADTLECGTYMYDEKFSVKLNDGQLYGSYVDNEDFDCGFVTLH